MATSATGNSRPNLSTSASGNFEMRLGGKERNEQPQHARGSHRKYNGKGRDAGKGEKIGERAPEARNRKPPAPMSQVRRPPAANIQPPARTLGKARESVAAAADALQGLARRASAVTQGPPDKDVYEESG